MTNTTTATHLSLFPSLETAWQDVDRSFERFCLTAGIGAIEHMLCEDVFRGRRGGLIKVLWHDGQGMCLFAKRLERGRFIWPSPADGVVTITPAQLGYLLEGIDWRAPQHTWRPQAAG